MQIGIILLVITGAIVVFAQKGTNDEDENGDDLQSLLYDRNEKEPTSVGGPPHEQINPSNPTVPHYIPQTTPHNEGDIKIYTAEELQQFYKNIQKLLRQVNTNVNNEINKAYNETQTSNNSLRHLYLNWVRSLKAMFSRNIKNAVKKGGDETEIQKCINLKGEYFLYKYANELLFARDCDDVVTNLAKKVITNAKEAFSDGLKKYINYEVAWSFDIGVCYNEKNNRCVAEGVIALNKRFKNFAAQSNWWGRFVQEVSRKHRIQEDICYQDFVENLKQHRRDFIYVLRQCVPDAEITESEVNEEAGLRSDTDVKVVPASEV